MYLLKKKNAERAATLTATFENKYVSFMLANIDRKVK